MNVKVMNPALTTGGRGGHPELVPPDLDAVGNPGSPAWATFENAAAVRSKRLMNSLLGTPTSRLGEG